MKAGYNEKSLNLNLKQRSRWRELYVTERRWWRPINGRQHVFVPLVVRTNWPRETTDIILHCKPVLSLALWQTGRRPTTWATTGSPAVAENRRPTISRRSSNHCTRWWLSHGSKQMLQPVPGLCAIRRITHVLDDRQTMSGGFVTTL